MTDFFILCLLFWANYEIMRDVLVGYRSGQPGQTVNLLSSTSLVRIQAPPPFLSTLLALGAFFYAKTPRFTRVIFNAKGAATPLEYGIWGYGLR